MNSPAYPRLGLYIGGEWLDARARPGKDVIDPAVGTPIAEVPFATEQDLHRAVDSAVSAYPIWRATSAHKRSQILRGAAQLMRERIERIAGTLTQEQGKPIAESRMEIALSADIVDWYAEEGMRLYGRIVPSRTLGTSYRVVQEPVGPVAAFTPWNVPAVTPCRKIGGALAAGCTLVIKAAEETPGACVEIVKAFEDAGLPKGVLNLVFGTPHDISAQLIADPAIRKVSFTGSTAVGKHLAKLAADGLKRLTMELGGHAPVLVFNDCDVEKAASMCVAAKFRNAGQVCVSPTRFYVHTSIFDRFVGAFTQRAGAIKTGNGLDPETQMGPLANGRRVDAMRSLLDSARQEGGTVMTGGAARGEAGYFFQPTVVTDLADSARLMTEEPFGPIAGFARFDSLDEVIHRANSLPYGLASYAFTESLRTANAISEGLEVGMLGVNTFAISVPETPFGGVKDSGYGYEGGIEGLDAYTVKKLVAQA
ncbi:NAD-dependent succinate-semialdehyde dehydrogenase [Variovorax sp. MHTC-1]|uniref:NAD-dependent succinate-semialdehyde dehydrogenase n=1 Tax=Variovorax sp. MHTC-1 TaxID=2495593 RepID=UPI000F8870F0|nr:NAD-dependent succinate-semialdehyde dehydrogenase [Variovorax sp. MHTC-1]RST48229.1 NAD-dependent succinate-semialdehyde dehydrogenase [Variovorax sp. MHTC-1]